MKVEQWCAPRLLSEHQGDAWGDGVWQALEQWVREYLCHSHPDLGRDGPVCPYTVRALEREALYGVVWPYPVSEVGELTRIMRGYVHWFDRSCGADADHALLAAFPTVPRSRQAELIEGTQRQLKTSVAQQGLMIGEFHDGPPSAPGVRNPAFRPLRSPVPLLAVRHMVRSDHVFLDRTPEHRAAYRAHFPQADTDQHTR
ncbi:DUF6875 domain-containing protein [Streptomyces cavernicola]|uniref:DUF6875 domain-containing protein n=1 Tax=Streptomyces cavernicola TaxID=3043613 RepID=A0ABT6S5S3_9ACTN|nr:hypothetical protein [Streptomyces sp. B-S-A6]MDI3403254.1 hypothetical protein [Streptomyces sp. B-S-A6]